MLFVSPPPPRMENCERGKQEEDPQRNAEIHEEEHPANMATILTEGT